MRKLLALPFVAAAILAVLPAAPALATGTHLCEHSANYCVGAPSVGYGDAVIETPTGRAIAPEGTGSIVLEFTGSTNTCVGFPDDSTHAVVTQCSGATGILFTATLVNGHWHFQNNHWGGYLAGLGNGSQFQLQPSGQGYFEAFDFD